MMPPVDVEAQGEGWTILEIVFCFQEAVLHRLDKLSAGFCSLV
jgi:hypothetical protein